MSFSHTPVMLREVVAALDPQDGDVIVDCTVGGGGHSAALLAAAQCQVIGLDRDPAAIEAATLRCAEFVPRFRAVRSAFAQFTDVLDELGIDVVNGVLADLGVSSHQLDTAERGFSLQRSGPIDMRMDPDAPLSAGDIVNTYDQAEIADILRRFGEERRAKRVAAAIVAGRPWTDTRALASAIAGAVGGGGRRRRIHPATRAFMALRIATNEELSQLDSLLPKIVDRLTPGGRLAVLTFHSLEDRIVKRFLDAAAGKGRERDPWGEPVGDVSLAVSKSQKPDPNDPNPRARSARLRSAVRV